MAGHRRRRDNGRVFHIGRIETAVTDDAAYRAACDWLLAQAKQYDNRHPALPDEDSAVVKATNRIIRIVRDLAREYRAIEEQTRSKEGQP